MKNVNLAAGATAAGLLVVAALPSAAQSRDLLDELAFPPLHRVVTPSAGPTGYGPLHLQEAYSLRDVRIKGKGQIIALVDAFHDPTAEADLGTFDTQFGLPACTTANGCFQVVYQTGIRPPADTSGWSNEIAIDTQWAHAIAPGAAIMLVEANSNTFRDLLAAVDVAVSRGATVVSMSWGGSESSNEGQSDSHFEVPGVTFVCSSGDSGHGVQYPAASPFVVGVGGTSLTLASNAVWKSETAWVGSGGGKSRFEAEPSYQASAQTSGKRGVPDVAYDADPNTGVPAYNSNACAACFTGWQQWGGTSIGAPQWAALFARANAARAMAGKGPLSLPHIVLYAAPASNYHDIVSGSNGGCGLLCTAGAGYDFVTGLGSPIGGVLIAKLGGS